MENPDLLTESYNYELDPAMIAARPVPGRHNSKLLVYNASTDEVTHTEFKHLDEFLNAEHRLVMNQSKVFPCRLFGRKPTGGKVELFLLSLLHQDHLYPVMLGSNGKKNIDDEFFFDELVAKIVARNPEGDFLVSFNMGHQELCSFLEKTAQIPIPPYIRDGVADEKDLEDYQTVYAKETGSVAAPTAGLHFTEDVFKQLEKKGIERDFVTLHVGAGTFKPVTADCIKDHQMHREYYHVDATTLDHLNSKKKIIAVGTTSLRVLESIYKNEQFEFNQNGELEHTSIFLHPGKEVKSIAGLITNFHLPKSTLLMLVSSLLGREKTLELYEIAKAHNYRFFSYGDAMLILR